MESLKKQTYEIKNWQDKMCPTGRAALEITRLRTYNTIYIYGKLEKTNLRDYELTRQDVSNREDSTWDYQITSLQHHMYLWKAWKQFNWRNYEITKLHEDSIWNELFNVTKLRHNRRECTWEGSWMYPITAFMLEYHFFWAKTWNYEITSWRADESDITAI